MVTLAKEPDAVESSEAVHVKETQTSPVIVAEGPPPPSPRTSSLFSEKDKAKDAIEIDGKGDSDEQSIEQTDEEEDED